MIGNIAGPGIATVNREASNMSKLILSAYQAKLSDGFHLQVHIMAASPFPEKAVEVRTAADCAKALEEYKLEAAATGKPMAISMTMARGERKPPGFNKLKLDSGQFATVNL
jgi:hypothetical protein